MHVCMKLCLSSLLGKIFHCQLDPPIKVLFACLFIWQETQTEVN